MPNKYHNRTCQCNQGHIHASRGEAGYCDQLMMLQKAGEIRSYRTQVKYDLNVNDRHVTTHIVDFLVETTRPDHSYTSNTVYEMEVREYKGFATEPWEIKHRLFEALYPQIPYIVVRKAPDNQMRGLKALARRNKRRTA